MHSKEWIEYQLLRDHPQTAPCLPVVAEHIVGEHRYTARIATREASNNVYQRRFASPVGTQQAKELAALYCETYALECMDTRKSFVYVSDRDCGRHVWRLSVPKARARPLTSISRRSCAGTFTNRA